VSTVLAGERGDGKIQGWHRARLAVIYVRQSSRQQVVDHGESTRLQYGLADRAVALGWPASRVMVIDEDLGRSAANAAERPGFARLVAEIMMGHVGLVLGLEMSRLARVGRDWHQLIELCSLAGALLADADGVYEALLHWVIPGQRRSVAWMLRSDGQCEVVEGVAEPVVSRDVGGDLVVAAAQVLHERVTGGQDSC
jgi:hypothetical protein